MVIRNLVCLLFLFWLMSVQAGRTIPGWYESIVHNFIAERERFRLQASDLKKIRLDGRTRLLFQSFDVLKGIATEIEYGLAIKEHIEMAMLYNDIVASSNKSARALKEREIAYIPVPELEEILPPVPVVEDSDGSDFEMDDLNDDDMRLATYILNDNDGDALDAASFDRGHDGSTTSQNIDYEENSEGAQETSNSGGLANLMRNYPVT